MRIVVSGASGLLGTALVEALEPEHEVVRLVRRPAVIHTERTWDPAAGTIQGQGLADVDAVINLSGAGLAERRWTPTRKRQLLESRIQSTTTLHRHASESERCCVMLSASAIGFYGDTGDRVVDESDVHGDGFLAGLAAQWEAAAPATATLRVAHLRTGLVVARGGGFLAPQLPLFRCGLGGRTGDGTQWQSWISIVDWVRAVQHLLQSDMPSHDRATPVNLVAPNPVTNADFVERLGHVLHRPTLLPVPLAVVRQLLGAELVDEALLFSTRVMPRALESDGFTFEHPDVGIALRAVLRER